MLPCTAGRAWAALVQTLPDLDANEVTIDGIWLANEGWDHHGDWRRTVRAGRGRHRSGSPRLSQK